MKTTLTSDRLISEINILTVNYSMTLEQMIAAGDYEWKDDELNIKNFPVNGDGIQEFEFELVVSEECISSENALKLIEKDSDPMNPWMPAQTEHLLAVGATFPGLLRRSPIVALGSVAEIRGSRPVPCIDVEGSRRGLDLRWFFGVWNSNYRFLRVRKVIIPTV